MRLPKLAECVSAKWPMSQQGWRLCILSVSIAAEEVKSAVTKS